MHTQRVTTKTIAALFPLVIIAGLFIGGAVAMSSGRSAVVVSAPEPAVQAAATGAVVAQQSVVGPSDNTRTATTIDVADVTDVKAPEAADVTAAPVLPRDSTPEPSPHDVYERLAEDFVAAFSMAHAEDDLGFLLGTLHPEVYATFGAQMCTDYVQQTLGSIRDMNVVTVGELSGYELQVSDSEMLTFDSAVPVAAQWTIVHSGEAQALTFHLAEYDGSFYWLTTCGH